MPGHIISHYKILNKLGEGGMGIVYSAEDTKLKRTIALKFLPAELTRDKEAKHRFIREAQAASALQHSNICTIHDIDETDDGHLFIVMDYYKGESLKEKITRGPLRLNEIIDYGTQIAYGLSKAHEKGIVHRDIKPANIFVTTEGIIKILDFGLAKLVGAQTKVTRTGLTLGTSAYMSPEQARGEKVGTLTDIWSFGVVLYEMITGQLPFKSEYEQAVLYSILNEKPQPIASMGLDIPHHLEKIVYRTLEKEPTNRYQNIRELLDDLEQPMVPGGGLSCKDETVSGNPSIANGNGKKFTYISTLILFIVVAAVSYKVFFGQQNTSSFQSNKHPPIIDSLSVPLKSIAVLPFENMSADSANAYFASGIRELILTKLAGIGGIKVIARTSSDQYKSHPEDLRRVSRQLGVATVLEGSVQKAGNQVLINVQLIDVQTHSHLWAQAYTRTLDNIFGVEGEVADSIARSLNARISPQEITTLHQVPTNNPEAYDLYLRANFYWWNFWLSYHWTAVDKAVSLYQQAIDLDPGFVLAYAKKAQLLAMAGDVKSALPLAEKALSLAPDLPETHLAMGYVHLWGTGNFGLWGTGENEKALEQFKLANARMPNNAEIVEAMSDAYKRLGMWQQARTELERATRLDPRNSVFWRRLGHLYSYLRLYSLAEQAYHRGLAVNPGDFGLKMDYLVKTLWLEGRLDSARQVVTTVLNQTRHNYPGSFNREYGMLGRIALDQRNFKEARNYFNQQAPGWLYDDGIIMDPYVNMIRLELVMGEHSHAKAIAQRTQDSLTHYYGHRGTITEPHYPPFYVGLAWVKAGLGDKQGAMKAGRKAFSIVSHNSLVEQSYIENLAEICTQTGQINEGLSLIHELMTRSDGGWALSAARLRNDPVWDPIRQDPRFIALVNNEKANFH